MDECGNDNVAICGDDGCSVANSETYIMMETKIDLSSLNIQDANGSTEMTNLNNNSEVDLTYANDEEMSTYSNISAETELSEFKDKEMEQNVYSTVTGPKSPPKPGRSIRRQKISPNHLYTPTIPTNKSKEKSVYCYASPDFASNQKSASLDDRSLVSQNPDVIFEVPSTTSKVKKKGRPEFASNQKSASFDDRSLAQQNPDIIFEAPSTIPKVKKKSHKKGNYVLQKMQVLLDGTNITKRRKEREAKKARLTESSEEDEEKDLKIDDGHSKFEERPPVEAEMQNSNLIQSLHGSNQSVTQQSTKPKQSGVVGCANRSEYAEPFDSLGRKSKRNKMKMKPVSERLPEESASSKKRTNLAYERRSVAAAQAKTQINHFNELLTSKLRWKMAVLVVLVMIFTTIAMIGLQAYRIYNSERYDHKLALGEVHKRARNLESQMVMRSKEIFALQKLLGDQQIEVKNLKKTLASYIEATNITKKCCSTRKRREILRKDKNNIIISA